MKRILLLTILSAFILTGCANIGNDSDGKIQSTVYTPMIKSPVDFNGNGVDDYSDFMAGARLDVENSPVYDGSFYASGGYPPDDIGVCSDTVWRAFRHAGYDLKAMVDKDIKENTERYPRVEGNPDPNIDFRRVKNLKPYFDRFAAPLTLDMEEIEEWNGGDIVIYENPDHIAIVSDKRNKNGRPYIIHNAGRAEEADRLDFSDIIGHYRFDAGKISEKDLIKFEN